MSLSLYVGIFWTAPARLCASWASPESSWAAPCARSAAPLLSDAPPASAWAAPEATCDGARCRLVDTSDELRHRRRQAWFPAATWSAPRRGLRYVAVRGRSSASAAVARSQTRPGVWHTCATTVANESVAVAGPSGRVRRGRHLARALRRAGRLRREACDPRRGCRARRRGMPPPRRATGPGSQRRRAGREGLGPCSRATTLRTPGSRPRWPPDRSAG